MANKIPRKNPKPAIVEAESLIAEFGKFRGEELVHFLTRTWNPHTLELPYPFKMKLNAEEKIDFAADLALLGLVYGDKYEANRFISLEAYLWSRRGRRELSKIGFLEGTIVNVKTSESAEVHPRILHPQIEFPSKYLTYPTNWLGFSASFDRDHSKEIKKICARFDPIFLKELLTIAMGLSRKNGQREYILSSLDLDFKENDIVELLINGPDDAGLTEGFKKKVVQHVMTDAKNILTKSLSHKLRKGDDDARRDSIIRSLFDRLVHAAVLQNVREIRPPQSQHSKKTWENTEPFVKYFDEFSNGDPFFRELDVWYLPDPEISLVCLEWSELVTATTTICGKKFISEIDQAKLEQLGLQSGGERRANVLKWAENIRKSPGRSQRWPRASVNIQRIVNQARTVKNDDDFIELIDLITGDKDGHPRSPGVLAERFKINCELQTSIRFLESIPRSGLGFPLTQSDEDSRKAENQGQANYFIGTFTEFSENSVRSQIKQIRDFVTGVFLPENAHVWSKRNAAANRTLTAAQTEVEERGTRNNIYFTFTHEIRDRIFHMDPQTCLKRVKRDLEAMKNDPSTLNLKNVQQSLEHAEKVCTSMLGFHGLIELLRVAEKMTDSGGFPRNWCNRELLDKWPDKLKSDHLEEAKQAIEQAIIDQAKLYEISLRRIEGGKVYPVGDSSMGLNSQLRLPPFAEAENGNLRDSPGPYAALAGIIEHVRNACDYMSIYDIRAEIIAQLGESHLDFEIDMVVASEIKDSYIAVKLFNPLVSELPHGKSIEYLQGMYSKLNFVRLSLPVEIEPYRYRDSKTRYVKSEFVFLPGLVKFEDKND